MKNGIKSNHLVLFIIVILLAIGFLAGCDGFASSPGFEWKCSGKEVDYGHGVSYFPCTGDEFGEALSGEIDDANWRGEEVSAITSDKAGKGYFVVFRPQKKCETPSEIVR